MTMTRRTACLTLTTAIGLAGLSSGAVAQDHTVAGVAVPFDQALRDLLPADVLEANRLTFTTDANGPPRTFMDETGAIAGVIPDLIGAVGATLGLETVIERNAFDAEVPGVESGRYDFTTGTGDFPHRREVLDMVDYYRAGYVYLVQAGNPKAVSNDETSQCGLRVGVIKGTTQETLVTELSERCVAAGLEAIDLQSFQNVLLPVPLSSDRVDVVWENTSTGFMVSADSPEMFEIAGDPIFSAYVAFGLKKDRPELRDAMQATLQQLMDTGVYGAIFTQWDQASLQMDYISVNSDNRQ